MTKPNPPQMTDDQRRNFEEALLAALLLLYQGKQAEARAQLGLLEAAGELSPEVVTKLETFATERAALVQSGINQRLQMAVESLSDDATPADTTAAIQQARTEIDRYNAATLMPFIASYVAHQALIDTYRDTPATEAPAIDGGEPGQSAADAVQWMWQQNSDFIDDCTEAEAASPASYDELVGVAGGTPPVHNNCACELVPNGP